MESLLLGVGLLFLTITIISIVLYFKFSDDIWYQGIWGIIGFVSFAFFIGFSYSMTNFQMGLPIGFEKITSENMDVDSFSISGQENISNSDLYHLQSFDNIDSVYENNFENADFCFYYNNTDEANVVFVGSTDDCGIYDISNPVYLKANTSGSVCTDIITSFLTSNSYIGIICADCGSSNTLLLQRANGFTTDEYLVNNTNFELYTINSDVDAHIYWLNTRSLPYESINKWFVRYLLVLSLLILGLGLRGIIKSILISRDVMIK